ncbi:MAG: exodeoxyribonuclease VII large subunit [Planctomycetota bacterium]|nr:exodeoxyribonuclease VII large subunit [Planctomycetota bacterium]
MSRLPFEPSRASGPGKSRSNRPARRERKKYDRVTEADYLTVSQLADLIKTTLEQRIAAPIRVVGQVSNLSARNHWYFSLKDESAVVQCIAWASSARKFGFSPKDGDEVLATGHVSHFPPQGRTQLYVTGLKPVGAGTLQIEFERMCAELRELGYFEEARKKPLPTFPRRIAVITSASGAAVHDVISTAAQRCKAVGLLIVDVRVQGEGAAEDVTRAIRWIDANHEKLGVDAILVTRGGGSIEDLWAFNERIVADAAFRCSVPLVAAIGHESDTTVIELVADLRAATPTQAAMRLVPSAEDLHRQVDHLDHRLLFLTRRLVEQARQRLGGLAGHIAFRDPFAILRRAQERLASMERDLSRATVSRLIAARARLEGQAGRLERLRPHVLVAHRHERLAVLSHRLDEAVRDRIHQRPHVAGLRHRLDVAIRRRIHAAGERLGAMERELTAIDPRRVLGRGYSYTTDAGGSLVRSIRDVRTGDGLVTHVSDGTIQSIVGGARRRRRRRSGAGEIGQMDLFDD